MWSPKPKFKNPERSIHWLQSYCKFNWCCLDNLIWSRFQLRQCGGLRGLSSNNHVTSWPILKAEIWKNFSLAEISRWAECGIITHLGNKFTQCAHRKQKQSPLSAIIPLAEAMTLIGVSNAHWACIFGYTSMTPILINHLCFVCCVVLVCTCITNNFNWDNSISFLNI